ncbi:MAG: phosphoribosylamine--glycine ligase [Candidatus Omnitrophica bacterium]|nr:phosphoribosylamine--glycine ligase [Candidatus Omnitrophota bacterium]MCM8793510.1 phosphoribosylamine--glycine ligase [Candidatus Omnitrophota bacterium]
MKILVVGSGGREHALVWKIAQSKLVDKIFCAPGNGGISREAECIEIKAEDIERLVEFARKENIDLTVVGPEAPLAKGIVDEFRKYGLRIFGPTELAARLESSKVFAKEIMQKYNIPTAGFKIFDHPEEAQYYIEEKGVPCVVKADGLAQGKGVVVAKTLEEAFQAVRMIMRERIFGDAGKRIVIEDYLEGEEASIIVITDSREFITFPPSQDHKRVFDEDKGPNTGGMGAYSPVPVVTENLLAEIEREIILRIINGLAKEGIDYRGALYAGIMLTSEGPKVLEFNVRFGDPETQALLPRLNSDLVEVILATLENKLSKFKKFTPLNWKSQACVCVVCASEGYPGGYEKGKVISGLEEAEEMKDIVVFHAGTKREKEKTNTGQQIYRFVTDGGRVLGVTGLGNTIKEAIINTYQAVEKIHFEGMHYRKDIGKKNLRNQSYKLEERR